MQQKILCSKCGAENTNNTQFCLYCGAILQDNCPNCGSAVSPASRFCSTCGAGLGWGMRIKDMQQQIFQTENSLMSSMSQISKDLKNDLSMVSGDLKGSLSAYGNELLAQQTALHNTATSINRLVQAEHRMAFSRSLHKIGLGLIGGGLGIIGLAYVLSDFSILAIVGIGVVLIGFILQVVSSFYTG